MKIRFDKNFEKQFKKLTPKLKLQTRNRINIFIINPNDSKLRLHQLKGVYSDYFSINITGDVRALYYEEEGEYTVFAMIGTHSQLYG